MNFLGIDPDTHGSVVLLDGASRVQLTAPIPLLGKDFDPTALSGIFRESVPRDSMVVMERVQSRAFIPPDASPGMRAGIINRSTKLFYLRGLVLGLCAAFELPITEVTPHKWIKRFGFSGEKERERRKEKIALVGKQRWPALEIRTKKQWSRADAAFLAEYGRTVVYGVPQAEEVAPGLTQTTIFDKS